MRRRVWLFSAWRQLLLGFTLFVVPLIGLPLPANAIGSTELIGLTNIERTKNGLTQLNYNGHLAASAYAKAQHMLAHGYWAHEAPDGTTPWSFVSRAGYAYVTVGENLARDFPTNEATLSGWMNSPGHRANILKPEFTDIGIASVSGTMSGEPVNLVVAHYGSTANSPRNSSEVNLNTESAMAQNASSPVVESVEDKVLKKILRTFVELGTGSVRLLDNLHFF